MIPYIKRRPYNDEIRLAVSAYLNDEYEASINQLEQFEKEFSEFMGLDHCICVSSGSAALHLALLACDVKPGDEVITTANACTAVSDFILWCGATPVFVDVEPETYNINTDLLDSAITSKTKAIIPVHLYGHPVDMNPILEIAERKSLYIIEDAAQAAGAIFRDKRVGTMGTIGIYSLTKNLGGYGGAILTKDEKIAYKVGMLRHFGRPGISPRQEILGIRYTIAGLNILIDRFQLKSLDSNNEIRYQNAQKYKNFLKNIPDIILPVEKKWAKHVYYHFILRVKRRDELMKYFYKEGIEAQCHYPIPIYDQGAYKNLKVNKDLFSVTEKLSKEVVSLPTRPNLQLQDLIKISETINNFYS
ncbi:DegT/DnrJ/EryC1/StrS family aminotransferase [Thermoproteota archaeon]